MGLSRDRAESALGGCADLGGFRRGALRSFLSELSDVELIAMRIGDSASDDEIAGFLDREEKKAGKLCFCPCNPMHSLNARLIYELPVFILVRRMGISHALASPYASHTTRFHHMPPSLHDCTRTMI
jgi:hypothetical protein